MDTDERKVRERVDVVSALLQAARSRRGRRPGTPSEEDAAIASAARFGERASADGWTAAFDAILGALGELGARTADERERRELAKMLDYLRGAEPALLRLASAEVERKKRPATAPEKPFLTASHGTPGLHADDRARSAPRAPFVEPHATRQLERMGREAVEEIASMWLLRKAGETDPWTIGVDFERRLLECLDAAVAYRRGPIAIDVDAFAVEHARSAPIVDASKWFAAGLLLACRDGDRAMTELRQLVLDAPAHATAALGDAICLGSNPGRHALALSLLEEDDRHDILAVGLGACWRLGAFDGPVMTSLVDHPRSEVASWAARCLGRSEGVDAAPALRGALDRPGVALDAAFTLALFDRGASLEFLREAAAGGLDGSRSGPDAVRARLANALLAAAGERRDEDLLLRLAESGAALAEAAKLATPRAADEDVDDSIALLADHGSPRFIAWLLDEMTEATTPSRGFAAAHALARITGVPMREFDDEGEERTFDRELFAKRIEAFVPPPGADRLRFGERFDLRAAYAELARSITRQGVRRRLAWQVALLRGAVLELDLDGWIYAQLRGLRKLEGAKANAA